MRNKMLLSEICKIVDTCEVKKDAHFDIITLVGKDYNKKKKAVTFISQEKFINGFLEEKFDAVICTNEIYFKIKDLYNGGICISDNPKSSFFKLHNYLISNTLFYGKKSKNIIGSNVQIHRTAIICEGNVKIGNNTVIGANVVINSNVNIGNDVIIREGSIIGTPAFYYFDDGKSKVMVESAGKVIINDNAEIHSNVVICKGVLGGDTEIGENSKVDSNIFIGHDTKIGKYCTIAASSSFGGWSKLGNKVFVGVGVSIAPNVKVGDNCKISIGAVVTKDVPNNMQISGNFAIEHNKFLKNLKSIVEK